MAGIKLQYRDREMCADFHAGKYVEKLPLSRVEMCILV